MWKHKLSAAQSLNSKSINFQGFSLSKRRFDFDKDISLHSSVS